VVAVSGEEHEITIEDVARVNEAARATSLPTSREIIHVIPREFVVDKQKGISDPTGMTGVRLEVEANIIHGSNTAIKNLTKCVQQVGVEVDQLIYSGFASAEAVLTDTEKELGTLLLDIGGGTIDMIVYTQGYPAYSAVLPIGGQNVTNDLAVGLRSLLEDAEKVKLKLATENELSEKQVILNSEGKEAPIPKNELFVGDLNIGMETVPKSMLKDIIDRRLEEALKFVQIYTRRAGYDKKLPAGVVITGGSASLPGITEVAETVFKLPIRIGKPSGITGLVDQIEGPGYSSGVGVLKHLAKDMNDDVRNYTRRSGNIKGIGGRVISFLKSFLP
jgi:cell division protein FtsA